MMMKTFLQHRSLNTVVKHLSTNQKPCFDITTNQKSGNSTNHLIQNRNVHIVTFTNNFDFQNKRQSYKCMKSSKMKIFNLSKYAKQFSTLCNLPYVTSLGQKGNNVRKLRYKNLTHNRNISTSGVNRDIHESVLNRQRSFKHKPPWRILFLGTDEIAVETLRMLHENMQSSSQLVESLDVVTGLEKGKVQRAVRRYAESAELKIYDWPITKSHDLMNKYDVGVLVSFGHMIPDHVIHMFPYGILNMHPSLLPRWRGASPIIHTVLNGDRETGVSVIEIRPKHFDIGPILMQRGITVPDRVTSNQLTNKLALMGAGMVLECLQDLPTLERLEHEQEENGVSYAHKVLPRQGEINWERQTAEQIDCQYRALHEMFPLRTELKGHGVKLLDMVEPALLQDIERRDVRGYRGDLYNTPPGTVAFHRKHKCLLVNCKTGIVGFHIIRLKRTLEAIDFYNGYIQSSHDGCVFTSLDNQINRYNQQETVPLVAVV